MLTPAPKMSFDRFRDTRRWSDDLALALDDERFETPDGKPTPGFIYVDCLFIERRPEGWWTLIERSEYDALPGDMVGLETIERRLYQWAMAEGYCDLPLDATPEPPAIPDAEIPMLPAGGDADADRVRAWFKALNEKGWLWHPEGTALFVVRYHEGKGHLHLFTGAQASALDAEMARAWHICRNAGVDINELAVAAESGGGEPTAPPFDAQGQRRRTMGGRVNATPAYLALAHAKSLLDLAAILNRLSATEAYKAAWLAGRDPWADEGIDLAELPTFGGEPPADTAGIYSWDASWVLSPTMDGRWAIFPR